MKKFLLLCVPFALNAQEFTKTNDPIENYRFAGVDWGDIDGDGDLDFVIAGVQFKEKSGVSTTDIYLNDGNGNFTKDSRQNLMGLHAGDAHFIDYDGDGDLDLVEMGISFASGFYKIAVYENVDGIFQETLVSDKGAIWGNMGIGDYDNDGDLDVIFTGQGPVDGVYKYRTTIWRNDNGAFTPVELTDQIPGVFNGRVNWVDIDGDDDLDILISGNSKEGGFNLRIYTNDNGNYTLAKKLDAGPYKYSQSICGDYDNDGDLDIAVYVSDEDYKRYLFIYRNDDLELTEVYKGDGLSVNAGATPLAFVDVDNDGDLDLVANGLTKDYKAKTYYYLNHGNDVFEKSDKEEIIGGHSVAFADVDGDLDADMLLTGFRNEKSITEQTDLYKNDVSVKNTAPTPPTNLVHEIENAELKLSWEGATDAESGEEGLDYHLSIGTAPGLSDVASYKVPNNHWKIKGIDPTKTYYWRVNSIDASGIYSDVSKEKNTSNLAVKSVVKEEKTQLYPNPVTNGVTELKATAPIHKLMIYNVQGQLVWEKEVHNQPTTYTLEINNLDSGVYYLKYTTSKGTETISFLVK